MNTGAKQLILGAGSALLAIYVQAFLPPNLTDYPPLVILNNSTVQLILVIIVPYGVFNLVIRLFKGLLAGGDGGSTGVVSGRPRRPEHVESTWTGERFGVNWNVIYGKWRRTGDAYAYAEDPLCPECGTDLMTDTKSRRVRDDAKIWKCPGCSFTQQRPSKFLYEEKDAVERMAERDIREQKQKR
jgi:ribosomal protein L37AE/L43A